MKRKNILASFIIASVVATVFAVGNIAKSEITIGATVENFKLPDADGKV